MFKVIANTTAKVWSLLTVKERNEALVLFVIILAGMFFEMLGVGMIIPLTAAIMSPEVVLKLPGGEILFRHLSNGDAAEVMFYVVLLFVVVGVLKFLVLSLLAWRQAAFTYGLLSGISGRLFGSYLYQPYQFHLNSNTSKLIRNAVSETQVFAQNFMNPAITLIAESMVLLGISATLLIIEPAGATAVIAMITAVGVAFYLGTRPSSKRWGAERQLHEGARIKVMQEGLSTIKELTLLGKRESFLQTYKYHAKRSADVAGKQIMVGQLPRLLLELVAIMAMSVLIGVQVYRGYSIENILPVIVLFAAAAFRLMPSVNRILGALSALHYSYPVIDVLVHARGDTSVEREFTSHRALPFDHCELRGVSFSYAGCAIAALKEVNIKIDKGEMIGIIGPSGAGKSTLVDLFLGLLPASKGGIYVNERSINECLSDWWAMVGYVPQVIVLVDDTIRNNIALGVDSKDIDEGAVWRALASAKLDDFVRNLPKGLETIVGERGVKLSGGQRQRIGIARSLYKDPEILVFDEATSALDSDTEYDVMDAINTLHGQKTILIIAHRTTTVKSCDRLYRLDRGQMLQVGKPAEVLAPDME